MLKHYHMQHNKMFFFHVVEVSTLVYVLLELKPYEIEKVKYIEKC